MAVRQKTRWLVVGALLTALGACDAVQDRANKFGKLTDDVLKQINGEEPTAPDPLTTASLEARALFGVMQAPVEIKPASLDELLQTQSYFAVGSVIAMPKAEMVEPVVEPETFDLAAADPAKPETPAEAAVTEALNTDDAPKSESAEAPSGRPLTEAAPPPPPTAPPTAESTAPSGAAAANKQLSVRQLPTLKSATAGELRT